MRASVSALLLLACLAASPRALPAEIQSGAATPAPIPFKEADRGVALGVPTAVGVLVLLALLGWGGLVALRRFKLAPPALASKARRVRVIETLRIDPRLTLYIVAADGKTLLLGRCGDTLVVAAELPPSDAPAEAPR